MKQHACFLLPVTVAALCACTSGQAVTPAPASNQASIDKTNPLMREHVELDIAIRPYINRPAHKEAVKAQAVAVFAALESCRDAVEVVEGGGTSVSAYGPVTFDSGGELTSACIIEPVDVQGCGHRRRENITTRTFQGRVFISHSVPGRTIADPNASTEAYLLIERRFNAPVCATVITDSEILPKDDEASLAKRLPAPVRPRWDELWTVKACGETYSAKLRFISGEAKTLVELLAP
jgi:hypothetical protein